MTTDTARQLTAVIEAFHHGAPLSGVIRISGPDGVILERVYGAASRQLDVPNRVDTRFHIASLTKMFIAALVLRLAAEGKLDLGAHPGRYLPAFAPVDGRVTLHHLLSQTSGLADIYRVPDIRAVALRMATDGADLPSYLATMEQLCVPGERWIYSSTGYLMLAYIAQAVTGRAFGALLRHMFLDPLGLHDTGEDDPLVINPGRALGHVTRDGQVWNAENDKLAVLDAPRELYSTVADLDRWGHDIFAGKVLSPDAARRSFTSYGTVDFDPGLGYGYGWFLGKPYRVIGGGTPGFRSEMWQVPERRLNIVMLWNNAQVESHRLFHQLRPALGF